MDATQIEMSLRQRVTAPAVCRCHLWHPAAAAAAAARQRALAIPLSSPYAGVAAPSASRRILLLRAAAEDSPPGSGAGPAGAAPPGFLQNPAIAQREALRLFYSATTVEAQQRVLDEAGALVDAGTRCGSLLGRTAASNVVPCTLRSLQLLCHVAEQAQRGLLPGTPPEQAALLRRLHTAVEPSLPQLSPQQLAIALWAYAAVGVAADWTDALLQQAAEQELAAPAGRLASYNTRELSSLLFAYGRLLRRPTRETRAYGAALVRELLQRWRGLPYVKSAFSSADFADLAEACAALFGPPPQPSSGGGGGGAGGAGAAAGGSADGAAAAPQLPAEVADMLDEVAYEVRRQLANKHSTRSPWTPRDLVRFARAYAALGHHSPKAAQMLDSLSSFCVQRIRSRHLNCVSRPADLTGLLEAFADLRHNSVVVPELLSAVGDQVRRGAAAAQEQEQQDVAAAAAATAEAAALGAGSVPASPPAAPAAVSAAGATVAPAPAQQQAQQPPPLQPQPGRAEPLSLAGVNSLLASHLRLGYAPPPLLLHSLAPQIRRQLAAGACSSAEAAGLLHLLAAVPLNPGDGLVAALLGRVRDAEAEGAEAGGEGSGGGSSSDGRSELAAAAEVAAAQLFGGHSS